MSEINFYNVDCVEFMKSKPDKYYDLAIVDLPYGIEADIKNNGTYGSTANHVIRSSSDNDTKVI